MRRIGQVVMLSVAFALATHALGWVVVPILAFAWGLRGREATDSGKVAAIAAGLGWVWLLTWTAVSGPAGELARRASGVIGVPSVAFVAITILFPMLLAWAAGVVGEFAAVRVRPRSSRLDRIP